MKNIILLAAALMLTFQGCKKESFDTNFLSIHQNKDEVYFENSKELADWLNETAGRTDFQASQFDELFSKSNQPLCYNATDLLHFLAQFGLKAPDYIPSWNNYIQDVNCALGWDYIGHERNPETANGVTTQITPDSVVWNLDGLTHTTYSGDFTLYFQTYFVDPVTLDTLPRLDCPGTFQPPCNASQETTVTVYINGAVYQRSAIGWAQINNVPESLAPYCAPFGPGYSEPSANFDYLGCFCLFQFEPYQFMVDSGLEWDLNQDGGVFISDLFIFLSQYGC